MFAVLFLAAALATAEPPAATKPAVFVGPEWARIPTLSEMEDSYPRLAWMIGVEGKAALRCTLEVSGRVDDCTVVSETPALMGFGDAALKVSPLFRLTPATLDGVPVASSVVVPINFRLPGGRLPGLDETLRCYGLLSAHAEQAPDDARIAGGADIARQRAAMLMARAGVTDEVGAARLGAARAATPPPTRLGATPDKCFALFVP